MSQARARERSETNKVERRRKIFNYKEYTVSLPIVSSTLVLHTERHGSE